MSLFGKKYIREERLAEDIRKGRSSAMKELYDTWSGYLLALCRRYVPETAAAEDILQESFIKIFASAGTFVYKGPGSLKAWMSRIAVNEALQYLRQSKRYGFVTTLDSLPETAEDEEIDNIGDIPSEVIQQMITELPDGYRTVFNLVVFEDMSHKEIGEIMGISDRTSASQYHRARKILAEKIRNYEKGLD